MVSRLSRKRKRARKGTSDLSMMPLDKALVLIRDRSQPPIVHIAAAEALRRESGNLGRVSTEDLLECLLRGHVAAEIGAYALNIHLGRRTEDTIKSEDSITDPDFWIQYAIAHPRRE